MKNAKHTPLSRLKYHISGAIERGEKTAIATVIAPKVNRTASIALLEKRQDAIVFESDEDEGAFEYQAEIESVLVVLRDPSTTDEQIIAVSVWVSEPLVMETK